MELFTWDIKSSRGVGKMVSAFLLGNLEEHRKKVPYFSIRRIDDLEEKSFWQGPLYLLMEIRTFFELRHSRSFLGPGFCLFWKAFGFELCVVVTLSTLAGHKTICLHMDFPRE